MSSAWRLAMRNLRRNRRRNVATAVAVALGYAGLVLFGGYISRIEAFIRTTTVYLQHTGHVAVYRAGGLDRSLARPERYSLTSGEQRRILAAAWTDPRVAFASRYLRGMGLAGNGCRTVPFQATGVEPEVFARILSHPDVQWVSPDFARPLRGRALPDATGVPGAIGLSEGLARRLGKPNVHDDVKGRPMTPVPECGSARASAQIAGDANVQLAGVTFDGSLSAIDGEIVNVFHTPTAETEDETILAGLDTLQALYATDAVTYVGLFLHDGRDAAGVARDLTARLAAEGVQVEAYPFTDNRVNPYYVGSMAFLESLLVFVGSLVTAVVVLGILNSVTLTVYERTREIGTLRALGWRRRQVAGLYLREGLILASLGVAAGALLAILVATAVNAANIRFSPPGIPGEVQLILWPGLRVFATVAVVLLPLSCLASWFVARRRARERTADLLTATTA
jgi:putative ABC transport system permease protein